MCELASVLEEGLLMLNLSCQGEGGSGLTVLIWVLGEMRPHAGGWPGSSTVVCSLSTQWYFNACKCISCCYSLAQTELRGTFRWGTLYFSVVLLFYFQMNLKCGHTAFVQSFQQCIVNFPCSGNLLSVHYQNTSPWGWPQAFFSLSHLISFDNCLSIDLCILHCFLTIIAQ